MRMKYIFLFVLFVFIRDIRGKQLRKAERPWNILWQS